MVEPVPFTTTLLPADSSVPGGIDGVTGPEPDAAQLLLQHEADRIALRQSFEGAPPPAVVGSG